MIRIFIVLLPVIFCSTLAQARDRETVWESDAALSSGGFGNIELGLTEIGNNTVTTIGGKGAWLINKRAYIGGSTIVSTSGLGDDRLTYGGLLLGYIFSPGNRIHTSVDITFAGGRLEENASSDVQYFAVLEPGFDTRFNLTTLVILSFGVSYRFINGVDTNVYDNDDLSGLTYRINLNIGKFD